MSADRLIALRARASVFLGMVFIFAAVQKIPDPRAFAYNVENFKLLPEWTVFAVALGLPWLELVVGSLLVLGLWTFESTLVFLLMSCGYIFGAVRALVLGLNISCGCFGKEYKGSAASVIALNAALLILYILILYAGRAIKRSRATEPAGSGVGGPGSGV